MIRPGGLEVTLVLATLALFPIQKALDASRGPPPSIIETLPPVRLLPALASGHRESLADLLEIRTTNFLMKPLESGAPVTDEYRAHLWHLYDAILELDPNNAGACWRAGLIMGSIGNRPHRAIAILKRGLGEPYKLDGKTYTPTRGVDPAHTRRWLLYYEQAAVHFLTLANRSFTEKRLHHVRSAGKLWIQAHEAGGPEILDSTGKLLLKRKFSEKQSLQHELRVWNYRLKRSSQGFIRKLATARVKEVQQVFTLIELRELVDKLKKRGRVPKTLDALGVELEPGVYELRNGTVTAPQLESTRLQRRLRYLLVEWKKRNPGQTPTLTDVLGKLEVPEYLQVSLTSKTIKVTPRKKP